jgi:hypothetical protein
MTERLAAPVGQRFTNLADSLAFGSGYSSKSVVAYVAGHIEHVTPAAYIDYIEGNDWPELLETIRKLLDEYGEKDTVALLHNLRKPKLERQTNN